MLETFTQLHTHRLCVPKKRGPDNFSEKRVPCVCAVCVPRRLYQPEEKHGRRWKSRLRCEPSLVKLEITNDMIFDEEQYEYLHNFINKPNKIKFVD